MSKRVIEIDDNGIDSIVDCLKSKINKNNKSNFNNLFEYMYSLFIERKDRLMPEDFLILIDYLESMTIFEKIPMNGEIEMYKTNGYELVKKLGRGSYGITVLITIKNKPCVMKIPIIQSDDTLKNNKKVVSDFMEEVVTHLLLECFHTKMEQYLSVSFEQPFPEIVSISKGSTPRRSARTVSSNPLNNFSEIPIYVMEPLDMNLYQYVTNILPSYPVNEQLYELSSIFLQIASNLYLLQKSIKFMHRDLHAGNIMVKKDDLSFPVIYDINSPPVSISRKYRTYIIDFGQSCAKLYNCCDVPITIFGTSQEASLYDYDNCKFNEAQDLRYLFASLYFSVKDQLPKELQKYIRNLIETYFPNITDYIDKGYIEAPQHFFYSHVIDVNDQNFKPSIVCKDILKLIGYKIDIPDKLSSLAVPLKKDSCTIL